MIARPYFIPPCIEDTAIVSRRADVITRVPSDALLDIRDYDHEVALDDIIKAIRGNNVSNVATSRHVMGYTIVDGIKAILSFSYSEYSVLYGWSSQRVICFTEVKMGRILTTSCLSIRNGMQIRYFLYQAIPDNILDTAL